MHSLDYSTDNVIVTVQRQESGCRVAVYVNEKKKDGGFYLTLEDALGCVSSRFGADAERQLRAKWPAAVGHGESEHEDEKPDQRIFVAGLATRTYDSIDIEEVDWLWQGRIALGKLTLIAGVPGVGKTFLLTDIMSRCSVGADFPDGAKSPLCESLIMTAEDGAGDTIAPRLRSHGADISKVHHMDFVVAGNRQDFFSISEHLPELDKWLGHHPFCKLVVMDPITAFMGDGIDSHKNAEVRRVLGPLCQLAERRDVAIVGVTHLSKSQAKAINRVLGSIGFIAAARAAWMVDWCPDTDGRRLFVPIKNNLAQSDGLAYMLEDGRLVWQADAVTVTADDLSSDSSTSVDDAIAFLEETLLNGRVASREIVCQAKDEGIAERTLNRAKKRLKVKSAKDGSQWFWELPPQDCQPFELSQGA